MPVFCHIWTCRVFRDAQGYGLSRAQRRGLEKRFRKGRSRTLPSPTRIYEYLDEFHNASEEAKEPTHNNVNNHSVCAIPM